MVKDVVKIVLHIVLVICGVIMSIPLWDYSNKTADMSIANSFANLDIYYDYSDFNYNKKNNVVTKSTEILYRNQNSFDKEYKLVMTINKNDNVNNNSINVFIDDIKVLINEYNKTEDDNNLYIELDSGVLPSYTSDNHVVSVQYETSNNSNLLFYLDIK